MSQWLYTQTELDWWLKWVNLSRVFQEAAWAYWKNIRYCWWYLFILWHMFSLSQLIQKLEESKLWKHWINWDLKSILLACLERFGIWHLHFGPMPLPLHLPLWGIYCLLKFSLSGKSKSSLRWPFHHIQLLMLSAGSTPSLPFTYTRLEFIACGQLLNESSTVSFQTHIPCYSSSGGSHHDKV